MQRLQQFLIQLRNRPGQVLTVGAILSLLAQIGQFGAQFLHWTPTQLLAWQHLTENVTLIATGTTGLWAGLQEFKSSMLNVGLPPPPAPPAKLEVP